MLDDRVRRVLDRLARADAEERERGLPSEQRMRAVAPTTGQFLFSLVAPQTACEVLEIGGSHGSSSIWLGAGVRYLGGRVVSIERNLETAAKWRENVREAGLEDWVEVLEGDAVELLPMIDDVFDVVFLDGEKDDYERYFELARPMLEPGGLVVADNVLSHPEELEAYVRARQSDPTLVSTTVPLDRGLELSVVLTEPL
ncbi:MAG TPA: class I SAM-dependent methyltransferase [Gaiellaceae bacterium]